MRISKSTIIDYVALVGMAVAFTVTHYVRFAPPWDKVALISMLAGAVTMAAYGLFDGRR
jgi:hypothetical protein